MFCPNCQSSSLHRIQRKGFFQVRIAALFGYYPWHCTECKCGCMLHKRGERRKNPGQPQQHRSRT